MVGQLPTIKSNGEAIPKNPILLLRGENEMKKFYLFLSLLVAATMLLTACGPTATPTPVVTQAPTQAPTEAPPPATEVPPPALGTPENPLIMALAPSATTQELIASGEAIAAQLSAVTGYTIITTVPTSYSALVEAMGAGNAHIGWLPPFAYVVAHGKGYADVALITIRFGSDHYGAQFIAHVDSGFTSYFDAATNANTADAPTALAQFADKKPCWTDPLSSSGYVIPSGYLAASDINLKAAAFIQGHPQVVRAVYARGICDFGATYIDARTSSALQADLPDVMDKVVVIWRTDPIIPNDNVSYATNVPDDVRAALTAAFLQVTQTEEGKAAIKSIYNIEELAERDDTFYDEFRVYLEASGVDVTTLFK